MPARPTIARNHFSDILPELALFFSRRVLLSIRQMHVIHPLATNSPRFQNQGISLSRVGSLPRSLPHLMFGDLRRMPAWINGRMFIRTPSFRSGFQPMACS